MGRLVPKLSRSSQLVIDSLFKRKRMKDEMKDEMKEDERG